MVSPTLLRDRALLLFKQAELELLRCAEYSLTVSYLSANGSYCTDRKPLGPLSSRFTPGSAPTDAYLQRLVAAVIEHVQPVATLTISQVTTASDLSLIGALDSMNDRFLFERKFAIRAQRLKLADFTEFAYEQMSRDQKRYVGLHLFDGLRDSHPHILKPPASDYMYQV